MNLKGSLTSSLALCVLYTTFVTVTLSEGVSKTFVQAHLNDQSLRKKRDLTDLDDLPSEEKRQRDFVGKRAREFVGKRAREFVGKRAREFVGKRLADLEDYDFDDMYPNIYEAEKRLRDFVGKRNIEESSPDKRMRDFVGKREFYDDVTMDKRLREFVGKRTLADDLPDMEKRQREIVGLGEPGFDNENSFEKRIRELVGKRAFMDKRIRELIGKRLNLENMYPVYFVRKPKYVRELIGKRTVPSSDGDEYSIEEKRMRDFVGK